MWWYGIGSKQNSSNAVYHLCINPQYTIMESLPDIIDDQYLLALLNDLQVQGKPAAMFVEDHGLGNEQGMISAIRTTDGGIIIELDGNRQIALHQIMAVNGIFRTGFSTC